MVAKYLGAFKGKDNHFMQGLRLFLLKRTGFLKSCNTGCGLCRPWEWRDSSRAPVLSA